MELLDKKGLTTVWAAIKNTFTSKSDADEKYAKKTDLTDYAKKNKLADQLSITRYESQVNFALLDTDGIEICNSVLQRATSTLAGVMTSADKNKLDGIATGANNYTLPVASTTTLGGIKTSVDYDQYHCFPICIDTNGVAYTKIDSISLFDGSATSYKATKNTDYTIYTHNEINNKVGSGIVTLRFPFESGTLALKSDIPDVPDISNLCKANLVYDISKCKEGSINIFVNNSSKDFSIDSIKDKSEMVVFVYVAKNCNITTNANMILYNNVPNFTGKVSVTPGMFLIIPQLNNIAIFSF